MASTSRSIQEERDIAANIEEIKVSYGQLLKANTSGTLGIVFSQRRPGRLMAFVKLGRAFTAELEAFDAAKTKLVEQHSGVPNEETNEYEFEDTKQANEDFQELMQTVLTFRGPKLSVAEFEELPITPEQGLQILWLLQEEE